MATYYALPTLSVWTTSPTGWSSTSGGAQIASGYPGSSNTDVVIFDALSGPSRTIDLQFTPIISHMPSSGSSKMSMSSSNGSSLNLYCTLSWTLDFSGFSNLPPVSIYANTNPVSLKGTGCVVMALSMVSGRTSQLSLIGDLTVAQNIVLNNYGMSANDYNVTCNQLTDSNASTNSYGNVNVGGGVWTFTNVSPSAQCFSLSVLTVVNAATTTYKINTSMGCTFNPYLVGMGSSNTLWIANGGTTGTTISSGFSIGTLRIDNGTVIFLNGLVYSATAWKVAGTSTSRIRLASNVSGATYICVPLSTGQYYLDYCDISDFQIGNGSAGSFVARSSTDLGHNYGITFYKLKPYFLSYF